MLSTYRMILALMTQVERRRFYQVFALVFVLSFFEATSVLAILPFLQVLSDPEILQGDGVIASLYRLTGEGDEQRFFVLLGLGVFLVTTFGLLFKSFMVWLLTRFALMRSYSISARLLSGYLHQPYIWFVGRHGSELGNTVLSEVDRMVSHTLLPAMRFIPDALVTGFLILALVVIEPVIALGGLCVVGGAYLMIYFLARRLLLRIGAVRVAANKARFHVVQEATGGIKELKHLGLEETYLEQFRVSALQMARAQTKGQVVSQVPRYALEAIVFGGMILLVLALLIERGGDISELVPTLGLIAAAGIRLFPALQQVYGQASTIRFNISALERIYNDMKSLDQMSARSEQNSDPRLGLRSKLEFDAVSYRYPSAKEVALDGVSFSIAARTTVGVVGGTGAGKTTLVDLLLGLLSPDQGRICVDGREITEQNLRSWQKTVGYVPQQIFLADDDIAANIAFGVRRENIDNDRVVNAARAASLHEFITHELSDGYRTRVGERGVRLSGGQRQRIGIARALYHDPDVLILDEATSALDNLTERAVMEAITTLGKSKTVIMIAHRLSTVRNCDAILLLRGGRLVTQGSYDDLLNSDAEFRAMAMDS